MAIFVVDSMTMIKPVSNSEIKAVKALSQKKYREEQGLFVVEGEKLVQEALASSFEVVKVYREEEVGSEIMSRLSSMSSASPALAVVRIPEHKPMELGPGLYLALDAIRDPGNFGTIVRIADWFGVRGVVASWDSVELFNPKLVQATMGAIFRVNVAYQDLSSFLKDTVAVGGAVYGTFLDGDDIYAKDLGTCLDAPGVIVIGNEANGISSKIAECVTDRLYIPPYPLSDSGSESLNAAVATAITVAEFRRRIHTL